MPPELSTASETFQSRRRLPAARPAPARTVAALALAAALPPAAAAQPFGPYVAFSGNGSATTGNGYLEVQDSPPLNPPAAITLEGWVKLATPFPTGGASACRTLIGKDLARAWWLGVCGSTVRASFQGSGSAHDAGAVPPGRWTHIAVTYDGVMQSHYVDGELIQSFPVSGPPGSSPAPLEVGGDVSWPQSPDGALTEIRLWNLARTVEQIRHAINVALTAPQPGLVAVWSLGAGGSDALGVENGTLHGVYATLAPPADRACASPGPGDLCVQPFFHLTVTWRTGDGVTGPGSIVPVPSTGSGIFWFFGPENWELMVKVINGCLLDNSVWVFTAAATNVFYRLEVIDVHSGIGKIYFSYPGPPAPAVTDTVAFPGACRPAS